MNTLENIWNTNLVNFPSFWKNIFAKLEMQNTWGSIKDRIAKRMIEDAEKKWLIKKWDKIIESTSWNTWIWLALICAIKWYHLILTMPESMSLERRRLIASYWAEIVLTPANLGMWWAIKKAKEIEENDWIWSPKQFENFSNVDAHFETTGPEIFKQTNWKIDYFISAVWTGWTITWVWKFLKSKNKDIKIIAIEPEESPVLAWWKPWPHKIQWIWAGFIPKIIDLKIIDEIFTISKEEAISAMKKLASKEWLLAWISSWANLAIAEKIAKKYPNAKIITVLSDTWERYLSNNFLEC